MAWGRPWREGPGTAVLAACVLLSPAPAAAQASSPISPFVAEKVVHDDNVFRLSRSVDPAMAIGSSSKGDTYYVTSAGLNLDLPVSRQRIVGSLALNDSRYSRFRELDFTGHDVRAAWLWQVGSRASGQLGYSDVSSLASFANIVGTAPDLLRQRQAFVNGSVLFTPRWRILAAANAFEQRNSDPPRRINDVDVVDGELALSYVTPAGSSLGVSLRAESASFPAQEAVAGALVDNAYRQQRAGLVAEWPISAASQLSGRIDRVRRRYDQLPQRDFDGTTARLQYDWKPTAKSGLAAILQHDISPYEFVRSSFVMVKGLTLRPTYSATSKLDVSANFSVLSREYLGDAATALGAAPARIDHVHAAGLLVSYRALRTLGLQLSLQHETRSSTIPFGDYRSNVVFLGARLAF